VSPDLERWYATLLRLYPASYRDEMLATLDEADRPAGRETVALLIGALRPRSGPGACPRPRRRRPPAMLHRVLGRRRAADRVRV